MCFRATGSVVAAPHRGCGAQRSAQEQSPWSLHTELCRAASQSRVWSLMFNRMSVRVRVNAVLNLHGDLCLFTSRPRSWAPPKAYRLL